MSNDIKRNVVVEPLRGGVFVQSVCRPRAGVVLLTRNNPGSLQRGVAAGRTKSKQNQRENLILYIHTHTHSHTHIYIYYVYIPSNICMRNHLL